MTIISRALGALLFLAAAMPALAIDPGTAQGTLQANPISAYKLVHAYAFRDKKEIRVVLSDQEAPKTVQPELVFLAVAQAARENKLRGLMIQINPQNLKETTVTVLHASVVSRSVGGVSNLSISGTRVIGEVESGPKVADGVQYKAKFSAPVFVATVR